MQSGTDGAFSIPRLELQSAIMAVRLKQHMITEKEMKINSCSFQSESTKALNWMHSCAYSKQQVFVANQIAEILIDKTDVSQ